MSPTPHKLDEQVAKLSEITGAIVTDAPYDIAIAGAGPAGLTTAIFAAERGLRVILLDAADAIGGALRISRGMITGAGTRLQAERGIIDSPERHYADAMAMSTQGADPLFLTLATQLMGPFVDWLMANGFDLADGLPRPSRGGDSGHSVPRAYWGKRQGQSILEVLERALAPHLASGRVELRLNSPVTALIETTDGIGGLIAGEMRFAAKATLLSTGGYAANPDLFARIHDGATLWSGAYPHATGAGLELGLKAGGTLAHAEKYQANFGGFLDPATTPPRYRAPGGLTAEDRPPWEIIVNRNGARFFAEDATNPDARAQALMAQPQQRAYVIYDSAIRANAPELFRYFPNSARFYGDQGPVISAPDLTTLAQSAGIDAVGLTHTITDYNAAVATQNDALGRRHLPQPIHTPPYYALPIAGYAVRSSGGLKVDGEFRVLRADGTAIPGLYALGETLGAMLAGPGGAGGMSLGPALAFGRYLGSRIIP